MREEEKNCLPLSRKSFKIQHKQSRTSPVVTVSWKRFDLFGETEKSLIKLEAGSLNQHKISWPLSFAIKSQTAHVPSFLMLENYNKV